MARDRIDLVGIIWSDSKASGLAVELRLAAVGNQVDFQPSCNPDGMTVEQTTEEAIGTWNREPLFHLSSPLGGWKAPKPKLHDDYICVRDFPVCWFGRTVTVEVEAKAKELAVKRLRRWLKAVEISFDRA